MPRRMLALALLAVALVSLALAWRWTPLGDLVNLESLVKLARSLQGMPFTPLAVIGGYVLAGLLMVPVTLLIGVTGIVFGPLAGGAYAIGGTLLSAAATYGIGRWLGRDTLQRLVGPRIERWSRHIARSGIVAMVVTRLLPIAPFTMINVIAGALQIRFRDYLIGTILGMAPGIFITVTFAMVDWTMSVNPHWFSTIWGLLYIGGQGLSAFAFGIIVLVALSQTAPLNRVLTTHHFHDLGKFLFAFLMLWAYLSFSQFLIIWSANIPEEIPHYLNRWENTWNFLSIFIVVGHFILPYSLLLSRDLKRNMGKLRIIATWILFARVADYYWHIAPEFHKDGFSLSILDVGLPLAIGGIFISLFVSHLGGRSLLPVNDPDLDKALHHHVH